MTSPSLQHPYVIDLIASQRVSVNALNIINTIFDSNTVLIATFLQVVDYTISCELTSLTIFLHLIRIDVVV